MVGKNSKISSNTINQVDFHIGDPYLNVQKMIQYIKPKIRFDMVHNSSNIAEEKEFKY